MKNASSRKTPQTVPAEPAGKNPALPVLSDKTTAGIFAGLILLAIAAILFSVVKANSEHELYGMNMYSYMQAQQAFSGQQYDIAIQSIQSMIPSYQESAQAQFLLGLAYLEQSEWEKAQTALQNARMKNARMVENQQFVHAYGSVMLQLREYAAAQQYFLKSIQLHTDAEITQSSQAALEQIVSLSGGTSHE